MDTSLNTVLKQEQTLSPQMLQSLALLPMSILDLKTYVQSEIESNPALEIPDSDFESTDENINESTNTDSMLNDDNVFDKEACVEDYYDEDSSDGKDLKMQAMENSSQKGETLSQHLLKQLGVQKISDKEYHIGELLIGNLDANGFYILPLDILFEKEEFTDAEIKKTESLVQSFDPYGICVKDFRQSLIVQAQNSGMHDSDLRIFSELIMNNLEKIKAGKNREVAASLHISEEDLETFISIMKSFTPYPGRNYDAGAEHYIVPEFSIHNSNGKLVLNMNKSCYPDLSISKDFTDLSNNLIGPDSKEASAYIKNSVSRAKNLMTQLEMRYKTMFNCAKALMEVQKDFFIKGKMYLKPMTLKDLAQKIDVHETTMSRLSQSKWIDTDWGLIQLKDLFTQGVSSTLEEGESVSRNVVKEHIASILSENPKLSDQKVSERLLELGIKCARRTVSKYRSELDISSSYSRS